MPIRLLYVLCAVQFVNILDFMMVMPLGPDFSRGLGIPTSAVGVVGGSYTFAAALIGIVGATLLDRFERRRALLVAVLGLSLATLLGGFAWDLPSLVGARILAGLFGGPATSISLAIVADTVDERVRGRAMGIIMGSFSIAAVLGVPFGLELAQHGGWHAPFFAVGALGLLLLPAIRFGVPELGQHLTARQQRLASGSAMSTWQESVALLRSPLCQRALTLALTSMVAGFLIIPNLATYVQFNLGYPREGMGMLYMVGGVLSFATVRIAGRLVDRTGATRTGIAGTMLLTLILIGGFATEVSWLPVPVMFAGFMVAMSLRNIPMQALASRVPQPHERARFMSMLSSVQHMSSSLGALLASQMLVSADSGMLLHMDRVALLAIGMALTMPWLMRRIELMLSQRHLAAVERSAA